MVRRHSAAQYNRQHVSRRPLLILFFASGAAALIYELVWFHLVTLVVGALQRAGLIDEKRGQITIRDRERLEAACCPCYRVMCEQQVKVLKYSCTGAVAA